MLTSGKDGERFIHYMGHVRMMAAAQPFISGAISKTVNMPNEATVQDIEDCYFESAKRALLQFIEMDQKLQPLSASSDEGDSDESDPEVNKILEEEAMLFKATLHLVQAQHARMRELIDQVITTRKKRGLDARS